MDFFFFFWSISPTPAIISENFPLKNEPRDRTLTQAETKIFSSWNLTMSWRDIINSLNAKEIKELKSRTLKIRASWFVRYTRILILSSFFVYNNWLYFSYFKEKVTWPRQSQTKRPSLLNLVPFIPSVSQLFVPFIGLLLVSVLSETVLVFNHSSLSGIFCFSSTFLWICMLPLFNHLQWD